MANHIVLGLLWYFAFLFSLVLHEASHALAGYKMGDRTAFLGGQVSLNPAPHIRREPVGTVVIPILSYLFAGWMIGWASAPYDPHWAMRYPKRSALMALAGPAANLVLLVASGLLIRIGLATGVFQAPGYINFSQVTASSAGGLWSFLAVILSIFFSLNLILFIFNMLPVPPFDGSNLILLFLNDRQAAAYMGFINNPMLGLISIIIAWNVFGYLFGPIHLFVIKLLYPGLAYY